MKIVKKRKHWSFDEKYYYIFFAFVKDGHLLHVGTADQLHLLQLLQTTEVLLLLLLCIGKVSRKTTAEA